LLTALDMRFALAIGLALAFALAPTLPASGAPEPGTDELRAGMCDAFDGLPFVFCVALCEARECDRQAPDDDRCIVLARGFARVTGGTPPPCVSARPAI
jgi:hypothetical protein